MPSLGKVRVYVRRWLIHWITCLVITTLVICFSTLFSDNALFGWLDHLGSDAIVRAYIPEKNLPTPVILIDLGQASLDQVQQTLDKVRRTHPKALGLDFMIPNDLKDASSLPKLIETFRAIASQGTPIITPIVNKQIAQAVASVDNVYEASPDLTRDDDGVVRTTQTRTCATTHEGSVMLPTLAAAMVYGRSRGKSRGCDTGDRPLPILFAPVWTPPPKDSRPLQLDQPGIYLVPSEMIAEDGAKSDAPHILPDGSYVVLGSLASSPIRDRLMTPLGERPGAVIQAEAVWTWQAMTDESGSLRWTARHRGSLDRPLALVEEWLIGAVAGAIFAIFTLIGGARQPISRPAAALRRFAFGITRLAVIAILLLLIGVGWTSLAVSLAELGILVGAGTAVFAAMLETLVHSGDDLISPVGWWVGRIMRNVLVSTVVGLLCMTTLAAHADECSYRVTIRGEVDRVTTDPPGIHPPWSPFDRLAIKDAPNTKVTIEPAEGSGGETLHLAGTDRPPIVILPPCPPPRSRTAAAWRSFWALLNPREQTKSTAATLLYRGSGDRTIEEGALRELSNLAAAAGTVTGAQGIAFAWAGGTPPYLIEFRDDVSGSVLGRTHTEHHDLWLPGWQTPARAYKLIIHDATGTTIQHELRPMSAVPIPNASVADAIELFQTAPEYRLEALRQLVAKADAGDVMADRAAFLIHTAGSAP
jgi:hypothetical protein